MSKNDSIIGSQTDGEKAIYKLDHKGHRVDLFSSTILPKASGFLWNKTMLLQANCRGFVNAQFMQPEPSKYSHAPNLEQATFMMPETDFYTDHPGRYFYIKDNLNGEIFSVPYEPTRKKLDQFTFSVGLSDIKWEIVKDDLTIKIRLSLSPSDVLEIWQVSITNNSTTTRDLNFYPYFTVGQMSWMNQSALFDRKLNGIVATSIQPYQKLSDYYKQKHFKAKTFLIGDRVPISYCANQSAFEGEGGLRDPQQIALDQLTNSEAVYERPCAALQYKLVLNPQQNEKYTFLFGPAESNRSIASFKEQFFKEKSTQLQLIQDFHKQNKQYMDDGRGVLKVSTPDKEFDEFINYWLPRQMLYHGNTNRLSSDPQTRNYLQDAMGMVFIKSDKTRRAILTSLAQQHASGAMPDGILLHSKAELKYINQIPHTDHSVWLPICLSCYLDETDDLSILEQRLPFSDQKGIEVSVFEHIDRAMKWLADKRDQRGLSYIEQGDWCDPMNMVGHKGEGVSGWLTMATSYALKLWLNIIERVENETTILIDYECDSSAIKSTIQELNNSINQFLWDGEWYARGITDDGRIFGTSKDQEGKIFLNTQSWAILCGAADSFKIDKIVKQVEEQLETPFGTMMLAPCYTEMQEDIGRVTQKSAGVAENGSVYNHASIFYCYSLLKIGKHEKAFELLKKMITNPKDAIKRGQLPVFIPNYYRGAYWQHPQQAGRSSGLFNTGTVSWYYRCLIDEVFGVQGVGKQLRFQPKLPPQWNRVTVERLFCGATFVISMRRSEDFDSTRVFIDGKHLPNNQIDSITKGARYHVDVVIPREGLGNSGDKKQ